MDPVTFRTDFTVFLKEMSDVDDTRTFCYAQISRIEQYLISLNLHRNTLTPVSRLPEDVLIQIFSAVARVCDQGSTLRGGWEVRNPHVWLVVTHVCRRWREIALHCGVES